MHLCSSESRERCKTEKIAKMDESEGGESEGPMGRQTTVWWGKAKAVQLGIADAYSVGILYFQRPA
jgi:hypothetical protein